jgi:formylglycine-generating enzyme required for sulfatase activity
VAYCRWLDEVLRRSGKVGVLQDGKYILRLATEAEWEKSARAADARRYPWGNEAWDAERANIGDSKIGHPTSVGMYPKGATAATAAALHDVGGNVWEWALSLYRDYPYRAADGCNDPNAAASRVVCGGSWGSSLRRSRCASRHRSHPDGWYDLQGFRVVLSLADSGF